MTEQTESQRLADEIGEDYCRCLPAYKDRGRIDPQCESCNTKDWRHRAAAELRRLEAVNAQLLESLKSLAAADFGAGEWTESAEQAALKARAAITAAKEKNHG